MSVPAYSALEMIRRLVAFETVSLASNLALVDFVSDYVRGLGLEPVLLHDESGTKANLLVTLGPGERHGGVVLAGHADVVPAAGQAWRTDPFTVVERDGRLYGRGTADMKSFLAVALALLPELQGMRLVRPLHLALTYDEETTCEGAERLVPALLERGLRPRAVIIGEPTGMRLVNAHKGHYTCRTRVTGHEAHASLTHAGASAITIAARLVGRLEEVASELAANGLRLEGVEPPHASINVGTIRGGTQFNIIAGACELVWEVRPVPGVDVRALVRRFDEEAQALVAPLRRRWPGVGVATTLEHAVDAFAPQPDSPAERLVRTLAGANTAGAVAYFTEAPYYQGAGWSTTVFGPGSIEQAHKPDEYIELEQVEACVRFVRALGRHLAAAS